MDSAFVPFFTPFSIGCFSVTGRAEYESVCVAGTFEDENLKAWIKAHDLLERRSSRLPRKFYVYIFRIEGTSFQGVVKQDLANTSAFKVGRSCNPRRRQGEWRRQCPSQRHTWFNPVEVKNYEEVERLVHAELEKLAVARPKKTCDNCGQVHQEIFMMADDPSIVERITGLIHDQNTKAQQLV
ncbi:hypothetical protein V5O48_015629 [Marasmius crinis-equi]|uniref:Bacteriophage T5 Orf172 DNA-binding domain-containing protein n=1 Tax=Marasmius crinis-equi TaxID=585013 RepID=A0ABR3EU16_9AGAR